jgi:hypothetical protein
VRFSCATPSLASTDLVRNIEISDVFNERAFIYYDIDNPNQLWIDRLLEKNQTAYDETLKEPILANGDQTIEDYFSFRDDVERESQRREYGTCWGTNKGVVELVSLDFDMDSSGFPSLILEIEGV